MKIICFKRIKAVIYLLSLIFVSNFSFAQSYENQFDTIGQGTSTNSSTGYPAPYGNYYKGARHQFLILASELPSFCVDSIKSLAFDVFSTTGPLTDFTIKIGHTNQTTMVDWEQNVTEVYTASSYQTVSGFNEHVFQNPFLYNGCDNIVVEVCFNNTGFTSNALTRYTTTSFQSVIYYRADAAGVCTNQGQSGVSSNRPNMVLGLSGVTSTFDAAICALTSPVTECQFTNEQVSAVISNLGSTTISTLPVAFTVNGGSAINETYTGSIAPGEKDTFDFSTLANMNAGSSFDIQVYHASSSDFCTQNDTALLSLSTTLNGAYTIGGSSPDYVDFAAAISDLNSIGVCADVTFYVRSGNYNEQLVFGPITGASSTDRVSFVSDTNNTTAPVISNNGVVIGLNDAAWVDFAGLEFTTTANSYLVQLTGHNKGIGFSNNTFNGANIQATSSAYAIFYQSSSSSNYSENLTIDGNTFNNGSYGMYFYGSSNASFYNKNLLFANNTLNNIYSYGIYSYGTDSFRIENNAFNMAVSSSTQYGVYTTSGGHANIIGNRVSIQTTGSGYGIYSFTSGSSSSRNACFNNMVVVPNSNSNSRGIYMSSSYWDIYHNSVRTSGSSTSTSYAAIYTSGTSNDLQNNIAQKDGPGYAAYGTGSSFSHNNNVFHTLGSSPTNFTLDATESIADPQFNSTTDLYITVNSDAYNSGAALAAIQFDIDSNARNAVTPDIGASEYDLPSRDVSVLGVDAPGVPFLAGSQSVEVSVINFGLDTITSLQFGWELNGVVQTPAIWTGSLAPGAVENNVLLGSVVLPSGSSNISAWSFNPNALADENSSNDTLITTICTALSGTYTLGGALADFTSFSELTGALSSCGVSGPITVNVNAGVGPFDDRLILSNINGLNSTNTLTINGNGQIIQSATTPPDYRIVGLDGVKHVIIDSLIIKAVSISSTFGVHFTNGADSNVLQNCIIDLSSNTSASASVAGIVFSNSKTSPNSEGNNGSYNVITNNSILGTASAGAFYGIILNGQNSGINCYSNIITNNTVENFYAYGIYLNEVNDALVENNIITSEDRSASATRTGIYITGSSKDLKVNANRLQYFYGGVASTTSSGYGIYLSSADATPSHENVITNNLIGPFENNGSQYGIYNIGSNGMWAYHNTIAFYEGSPSSTSYDVRGIYQTTSALNIKIENNIIYAARGGNGDNYALYFNTTTSDIYSDNNVLYTDTAVSNNYIGYYGGNAAGIGSWQNAASPAFDSLSLYENPFFSDLLTGDLEPNSININDLATPVAGVTTDYSGAIRSNPTDFGAMEFDVVAADVALVSFVAPESTPNCQLGAAETVSVTVKNYGSNTATAFSLSYWIDNGTPVTEAFSGFSLPTNESDTFTFATTANLSAFNTFDLTVVAAYTGDTTASNDSLSTTVTSAMIMVGDMFDFESESGFSASLNSGWTAWNSNGNINNPRWEALSGLTISNLTGPSGDHTNATSTANGTGKYMFVETSTPSALGDTAYLQSGCLNLGGTTNPAISFWYHMYGETMGNLYLEAYDGASWIRLDSIVGEQQLGETELWKKRVVKLCGLSGFTQIRFVAAAGTSFYSDMAIDDVAFIDLPEYNDEAIIAVIDNHEYISVPVSQVNGFGYEYAAVVINKGSTENTNIQVSIDFANGSGSDSLSIGSHAECSEDTSVIFSGPFYPNNEGMYYANVSVSISEMDSIPQNNVLASDSFAIVDSVYARDNGVRAGGLGATGVTVEFGQLFHISTADTLTQLTAELAGVAGDSCRFKVYSISNGLPDSLLIEYDPFILNGGIETYTEEICNNMIIPADTYFVVVEQLSSNNMNLSYSEDNFTSNRAFYRLGAGAWTVLDSANFPNALNIRVVFGHERAFNGISQNAPLFCPGSTLQLSTESYAKYAWSNSDTTQTIDVSAEGMYYVTVSTSRGCEYLDSVFVEDDSISASISNILLASCGLTNGAATVAPEFGFGSSYSYAWPNGDTTSTSNGLSSGTYVVTVTDSLGCETNASASISNAGSPVISFAVTDVVCGGVANGEVSTNVSGGITPYNYTWSNGSSSTSIENLNPGIYTLTITDSLGCVVINDTAVVGNDTLQFNTSIASDISCFGFVDGEVVIDMAGGVTPYSFSWSSGATTESVSGLGVGSYTLNAIDSVGCTLSGAWSITQPAALVTGVTSQNITCYGDDNGSINLSTSGGTSGYMYAWSNSATTSSLTNLHPDVYNYTVSDANGCMNIDSLAIIEPTILAINTVEVDASCFGGSNGSVTANVGGGTPNYTYLWNNGDTASAVVGLTQGSYALTVTDDNGCTATVSSTVNEPSDVSFVSNLTNVDCNGNTNGGIDMSVFGGTMPYSYAWTGGATTQDLTNVGASTYGLTVTDANSCTYTTSETITEPTAIVFALDSSMNIDCFGESTGAIYTTGNGGTMPYMYTWSNGGSMGDVMNLMAGTYAVTLTDANGCTETTSETLTENPALTASIVGMDEGCIGSMDGSATVTIGGGVMPYAYSWNNAVTDSSNTNIGPGMYMVTATDAMGCMIEDMVTIDYQFELPVVDITGDSEICGDATTTLDGGAGFISYAWSNGDTTQMITGDASGVYNLMVVDGNGCVNSDSFALTVLDVLTLDITVEDEGCFGDADGSLTANVGGGVAPYNYTWNDPMAQTTMAATGLGIGNYTVDIVDSKGCTTNGSDSVSYQFDNPVFALTDSSLSGLGPFVIDAGAGFAAYQWNIGVNTQTITVGSSGNYAVVVTDGNGCSASDTVMVAIWPTGVEDVADEVSVSLYPNPTNGAVNIDFSRALDKDVTVKVISMNGEIISQEKLFTSGSSCSGQIDLSTHSKGMYMIELTDGSVSLVKRIIVH
jgi:hypothetical protein